MKKQIELTIKKPVHYKFQLELIKMQQQQQLNNNRNRPGVV